MTFEELTALAKAGETPKYISDTDWLVLRCLTGEILRYRRGESTAEELALAHKGLGERHARIEMMRSLVRETDRIRVALGGLGKQAKETGCPVCQKVFAVLDGVGHEEDDKV